MQHDGSNSARARSARIRASHEYEATELDTMRRHGAARELQQRPSFVMRLSSLVARARDHRASRCVSRGYGYVQRLIASGLRQEATGE